ncbi:MAG: deoxyribose-phosphate aldolase [Spirochaetales bacterium]|uniref:Deoxyribose-phosphate aldolase n=1 Tax=Candidatus Thalassospirochaeta sargassi TaxID=3119039 RepID=A0AAJ1ML40_9SPIO|nr:deoxyribose-phosphate aldolase [Spirochaetales bacterium]
MNAYKAARKIDISAVRTHHGKEDIDEIVRLGKKYNFINVHALPCWTSYLAQQLKDFPEILVGSPVGFPGGAHKTETKIFEAKQLVADGVQEMDLVMNIGKLRSAEYNYIINEIKEVNTIAGEIPLKVIIEINALNNDEMKKACELVIEGGADFIKTGTGWIPGDANLERIETIMNFIGDSIKLKAAGGVRTREEFIHLDSLGIHRFGINIKSAIEIVESFPAK